MTPRGFRLLGRSVIWAAIGIAAWGAQPSPARAQDCRPVLDRNVIVEQGEARGCRLWVVGHHVAVVRGGSVDGGIVVAYGSADVDGDVDGAVNVINGDATINGSVTGDVYASGAVKIGDDGHIGGSVTGATVQAAPGAAIEGATTLLGGGWTGAPRPGMQTWVGFGALLLSALVTAVLAMLFGGLATVSFPGPVARLCAQASRSAAWTFIGIVLGLGVIVATGAVIALLYSVPLVRWLALVPLVLAAGGALGIGQRLGARILPNRGAPLQTGLGLAVITIAISLITRSGPPALFCLGGLLLVIFSGWSIGVVLLSAARQLGADETPALPSDLERTTHRPIDAASPALSPALSAEPLHPSDADANSDSVDLGIDLEVEVDAAFDLRRIPGITPIYAHLLRTAGIASLRELADASPGTVVDALVAPNVLPVDADSAALWIEMARRRLGR